MKQASAEEKQIWQSGIQKYLTLEFDDGQTFTNDDICAESMELEQAISDDDELRFGQCSATCFKVQIFAGTLRFKGLSVTARITAGGYTRNLGTYIVDSDEAMVDRLTRELVCYDELHYVMQTNYASWHNALSFPMTVKNYRDNFFNYIGIQQEETTLPNDETVIQKNFVAEDYSGAEVLHSICEINGTFGYIDFDGVFRYVRFVHDPDALYPSETLYPAASGLYPKPWTHIKIGGGLTSSVRSTYIQGSLGYEEYETATISKVQIRQTSDDVGAVIGEEGNTYIIENNPLLYGKNTDELAVIATRFLNAVKSITYTPSTVQCPASPWIELGDSVGITIPNGDSIFMFILHRTMSGITRLVDSYEAKGQEYYSEKANSTNRSLTVLKQKTNELVRTAEETVSTLTEIRTDLDDEIETRQSQITQTADAITAEVTRASAAEGNLSSRISQSAHTIELSVSGSAGKSGNSYAGITITLKNENGDVIGTPSTGKVYISGDTVFTSQLTDGATTISGNNITTGSISASRIKGDTLTLGGRNNVNGQLSIMNVSSNEIGTWNKDGIVVKSGTIQLGDKSSLSSTDAGIYIGSDGVAIGRYKGTTNTYNTAIIIPAKGSNYSGAPDEDGSVIIGKLYFRRYPPWDTASSANSPYTDFGLYGDDQGRVYTSGSLHTGNMKSGSDDDQNYFEGKTVMGRADVKRELYVGGDATGITPASSGHAAGGDLFVYGTVYADGYDPISNTSDERLKTDVMPIKENEALAFIMSQTPVSFKWRDSKENRIRNCKEVHHGLIAQKVQATNPGWDVVTKGEHLGIRYQEMLADLIKVVQSQERRIGELDKQIAELRKGAE